MIMRKSYEARRGNYHAISWKIDDLTSEYCEWYKVDFYKDDFPISSTHMPIRDEFDAIRLVDGWVTPI